MNIRTGELDSNIGAVSTSVFWMWYPYPSLVETWEILYHVHSVCQIGLLYFLFIQLYALNSLILFKMFIIGNEVWIYEKYYIYFFFCLNVDYCTQKCAFWILPFLVDLFNFVILTAMIYKSLLVIYIYSPWTFLFDWRAVAFQQILWN